MAEVTRTNPKAFQIIADKLKSLDGIESQAGWFSTAKYPDGTPVAEIAQIQEFGAHITQYGSKAGDYTVVIPPRPFMRPTVARESQNWLNAMGEGAKAVLAGKMTAFDVLDGVALNAQEEIKRSITQVTSPPLKPATIAARLRRRADKKTRGLLDAPLRDTFTMYDNVQHRTGAADGTE